MCQKRKLRHRVWRPSRAVRLEGQSPDGARTPVPEPPSAATAPRLPSKKKVSLQEEEEPFSTHVAHVCVVWVCYNKHVIEKLKFCKSTQPCGILPWDRSQEGCRGPQTLSSGWAVLKADSTWIPQHPLSWSARGDAREGTTVSRRRSESRPLGGSAKKLDPLFPHFPPMELWRPHCGLTEGPGSEATALSHTPPCAGGPGIPRSLG